MYDEVNKILGENPDFSFLNHGYWPIDNRVMGIPVLFKTCASLYLKVAEHLDLSSGYKLLEVGCGRGGGISVIKRFYPKISAYACDRNKGSIAYCIKNQRQEVEFRVCDSMNLDYPESYFDVVLNIESSHCYNDVSNFFSQVALVLRLEGKFLYADIFSDKANVDAVRKMLQQHFVIEHDEDITENVYLSCANVAEEFKNRNNGPDKWAYELYARKRDEYKKRLKVYHLFNLKKRE